MAKEVKQWITVKGRHIPIFEGETAKDAIKRMKEGGKSGKEHRPSTSEAVAKKKDAVEKAAKKRHQKHLNLENGHTDRRVKSFQKAKDEEDAARVDYVKTRDKKRIKSTKFNKKESAGKNNKLKSDKEQSVKVKKKPVTTADGASSRFANHLKNKGISDTADIEKHLRGLSSTRRNKLAKQMGIEGRGEDKIKAMASKISEQMGEKKPVKAQLDKKQLIQKIKEKRDEKFNDVLKNEDWSTVSDYLTPKELRKFKEVSRDYYDGWDTSKKAKAEVDYYEKLAARRYLSEEEEYGHGPRAKIKSKKSQDDVVKEKQIANATEAKDRLNGKTSEYDKWKDDLVNDMTKKVKPGATPQDLLSNSDLQGIVEAYALEHGGDEEKILQDIRKGVETKLHNSKINEKSDAENSLDETAKKFYDKPFAQLNKYQQRNTQLYNRVDRGDYNLDNPLSKEEISTLAPVLRYKYAGDMADASYKAALKQIGIKEDEAHLIDFKTRTEVEKAMHSNLLKSNVDLSFDSTTTKMGVQIGGNREGITSSYFHGKTAPAGGAAWEEITLTPAQIKEHLAKNKNAGIYEEDKFGAAVKSNAQRILGQRLGNSFKHQGIGSQASIVQKQVKLYRDKKGNLKLSEHSFIWD